MSTSVPNLEFEAAAKLDLDPATNVAMALAAGVFSLFVAVYYAHQVVSFPVDQEKKELVRISNLIAEGAEAFLISEYFGLAAFVAAMFGILAGVTSWQSAVCFLGGAILSGISGYLGMKIATKANVRTTLACQGPDGLNNGLRLAFKSGAVMALMVVGTGLTGLSVFYLIFETDSEEDVWEYMSGFAFGGSSIALFARVGGGIYTKAADVGADLVGKVEEELDEDSPDNPATIADNVGDNVGDVAGMGADLFESFVGSIIAAATLGRDEYGHSGVALPFWVAGIGAICSIIGTLLVRADTKGVHMDESEMAGLSEKMQKAKRSEAVLEGLLGSIRFAIYGASLLVIGGSALAVWLTFGSDGNTPWNLFTCIIMGLVCGNLIGYFTEYATSYTYWPTQSIAQKSDTGSATVIIQGLGVGMLSTIPPVFFIVATILGSYYASGSFYGPSIAAVGMLSTLGVTLATDAFGPVADNAGGIAEMAPDSEVDDEVRETTDSLDALGNTTAATGKGFAIGSAVLTALALMQAFAESAGIKDEKVDLLDPVILPAVLLGALLPFVFAALTMLSVGKAAESIMWECRDQLNKKHLQGAPLDPARCVKISTISALQEMIAPGCLAVFFPAIIGTLLGSKGLLGLLTGSISSGFLLAVMLSNAGGAWDNAKKFVEKGNLGDDKAKKSDNHKAVVVGDTVGDPFKDTSGPALNILVKLMSIVSLVLAPELGSEPWDADQWWVSLIIVGALVLLAMVYNKFVVATLHDYDEILSQSKIRKAGGHMESGDGGDDAPAGGDSGKMKETEEPEVELVAVDV